MELRLPLEMSPGREAACRAVFGTWGFFPNDARKNCPFVLTAFKEMAACSSVLAWRIPGTGEPGGLHRLCGRTESDMTEVT